MRPLMSMVVGMAVLVAVAVVVRRGLVHIIAPAPVALAQAMDMLGALAPSANRR